ncbi:unnamed protein product [Clonostachys rhizophaga]|uniref:Methyltransferase type 11 domain-containing protein n=1 Tax=Clonostachys rhizophaga TaxID=160324 RepID=A0A9N9VL53_9HYPO|nr:unnamed protein product [Clonostachys rhizophaga]
MSELKTTAVEHFEALAANYEASTGGATRMVAVHLVSLVTPSLGDPSAVILDNAYGSGKYPAATIHAVDGIAKQNLRDKATSAPVEFGVMPGEKLEFPDGKFSHSFTNMGIMFFTNPAQGAAEIYRTLRPGGTAVVTSWSKLGHLDLVFRPAHVAVRPDDEPVKFPLPEVWHDPEHVRKVLSEAGFKDDAIEVSTLPVQYGAKKKEMLLDFMMDMAGKMLTADWPEADKDAFRKAVAEKLELEAKEYTMLSGEPGFGLPMEAIVVVCRK